MVNGIDNSAYFNKFGEDTLLSKIQKDNEKVQEQDKLINTADNENSGENEILEEIKEKEIAKKITEGKSVSLKELKYIKKNNRVLLQKAKKVNALNKNMKNQIKSDKSNEEAANNIKNKTPLISLDKLIY